MAFSQTKVLLAYSVLESPPTAFVAGSRICWQSDRTCTLRENPLTDAAQILRCSREKAIMPKLDDFIPRLGTPTESFCSTCCRIIRPTADKPSLAQAEAGHACEGFSLNMMRRLGGVRSRS